jgi:hypothetical protein
MQQVADKMHENAIETCAEPRTALPAPCIAVARAATGKAAVQSSDQTRCWSSPIAAAIPVRRSAAETGALMQ